MKTGMLRLVVAASVLGLLASCQGETMDDAGSGGEAGSGTGAASQDTGGRNTGGDESSAGGSGGEALGGQNSGGQESTGGTNTGGLGGSATGGSATGGSATGGSATGGSATGGSEGNPEDDFITVWKTDAEPVFGGYGELIPVTDDVTIVLPLVEEGTYDFSVAWGDGSADLVTAWDDADRTHVYAEPGEYTVVITGTIEGWHFDATYGGETLTDGPKLLEIQQWGTFAFAETWGTFSNCANLTITAEDVPDLSATTTLASAFSNCVALEEVPNIGAWDVSGITNIAGMFLSAQSFDQALAAWDVSNVTDMNNMFWEAAVFDGDISTWDVSGVTDMEAMFWGAESFNQDISAWNVGGVTNMVRMFAGASAFNADISAWDVSNVTSMAQMFGLADAFNQDISGWDVSKVTSMEAMFQQASSFDQSLGAWEIPLLTTAGSMLSFSGLSTANYDATLIGWAAQTTQSNVTLGAQSIQYSAAAQAARGVLVGRGWTITDGGLAP